MDSSPKKVYKISLKDKPMQNGGMNNYNDDEKINNMALKPKPKEKKKPSLLDQIKCNDVKLKKVGINSKKKKDVDIMSEMKKRRAFMKQETIFDDDSGDANEWDD